MERSEFLFEAKQFYDRCYDILSQKNADYANAHDALKNFNKRGIPGILTRVEDKLSRLDELINKGKTPQVSESVEDTCMDIANYMIIAAIVWSESIKDALDPKQEILASGGDTK